MYVCMYVCMSVTDVGAVSISDCACSLRAEVRILAVYAKYMAPPTKSMSAPAIQKSCSEDFDVKERQDKRF